MSAIRAVTSLARPLNRCNQFFLRQALIPSSISLAYSNLFSRGISTSKPISSSASFASCAANAAEEGASKKTTADKVAEEEGVAEKKAEDGKEGETTEGKKAGGGDPNEEKIAELETQLEEQKEKVKDLIGQIRYAHADFENARKRHTTEMDNAKNYGINKFAKSMVEVADNLDRAMETVTEDKLKENEDLKALFDGVKMTEEAMIKTFSQYHISRISPMGDKFDPKLHEAMFTLDSDEPKDTIVHVMQPGWKIKDRLLRAARVGTSKGPSEAKKE